jgi:mercuric ion transport protein
MKRFLKVTTVLLIVILFTTIACNSSGKKTTKTDPNAVARMEVSISGMSCTSCEQKIQTGVAKVEGVKTVKAICSVVKAFIDYNPTIVDTAMIRKAITESGFVVTGLNPLPLTDSVK